MKGREPARKRLKKMDKSQEGDILIPLKESSFKFRCHKDIPCFTECCARLNLLLTPYDVLRLKNRLGISSEEFLDTYTDMKVDERSPLPMVRLKMNTDEKRTCPFVTPEGCTLYEDRPGACRMYPVGRAALNPGGGQDTREKFFIVREDHCLGFQEEKNWTLEEWLANEGLEEYNAVNDHWMEIITSGRSLGRGEEVRKKIQMFYMASYNLDKFREFIFKSRFLDLFEVEEGLQEKLRSDDMELLRFALRWLKFSLFGEKTITLKK
jgi:Fe-S-cluster containining protein